MSISNYKRYGICPECNNELIADGLMAHFRRAHKKELSAVEMATILSHITREPTRKPNLPRNPQKFLAKLKDRQQREIERKMKTFGETTPFSMRQWGDDRPHRTGPI
jgi:hypothetical protein